MGMMEAINELQKATDAKEFTAPEAIEAVRLAAKLLNKVASESNPEEFFSELILTPAAMGQVLMHTMPAHMGEPGVLNGGLKAFWCQVAEELGPDWIEAMRVAAAFMKRVEGFQGGRENA